VAFLKRFVEYLKVRESSSIAVDPLTVNTDQDARFACCCWNATVFLAALEGYHLHWTTTTTVRISFPLSTCFNFSHQILCRTITIHDPYIGTESTRWALSVAESCRFCNPCGNIRKRFEYRSSLISTLNAYQGFYLFWSHLRPTMRRSLILFSISRESFVAYRYLLLPTQHEM